MDYQIRGVTEVIPCNETLPKPYYHLGYWNKFERGHNIWKMGVLDMCPVVGTFIDHCPVVGTFIDHCPVVGTFIDYLTGGRHFYLSLPGGRHFYRLFNRW